MSDSIEDILSARDDAPHNFAEALEYARKLYGLTDPDAPPQATRTLAFEDGEVSLQANDVGAFEWCGEATHGLLDGCLHSNLLSQSEKDEITELIDAATPTLERQKTSGHFSIRWTETSNDPYDNVTEADIDLTLSELNAVYDFYAQHLRAPRSDAQNMISVSVYFNGGLHGSTSSQTNHVFLNSRTVVSDDCRRRTTTAHELFHRVEYEYGYVTGTADQRWWVEALGSWSQDIYAPDIKDYIHRVNIGLQHPNTPLGKRSYDACHFWKLLTEQAARSSTGPATELEAVKHFLEAYEQAGADAKTGVDSLALAGVGADLDGFYESFGKANFVKDLTGAPVHLVYDDNKTQVQSCGRTNGPFRRVDPVFSEDIDDDQQNFSFDRHIAQHASAYGIFNLGSEVTNVRVRVVPGGGARLSGHLVSSKDGVFVGIDEQSGFDSAVDITASFSAGTTDQVTLVINGLRAGTWRIEVNP